MRIFTAILLAAALLAAGCSNLSYYLQSVDGQMKLMQARQPIAQVLADPATPSALKSRLERVLTIRAFASSELNLPDNDSYRSYADLQRPFVVWNVFATEEFSIKPRQWCFPVAGCVGYKGYFSQAEAQAYAQGLGREGLDVFVGGVPAYSTLGWFDDPVLNTFVNYPDYELARLIFHELAHQTVYVKDDSEFNESFAASVEDEGVRRWIARNGDARMSESYARAQQRRSQFAQLVLKFRGDLGELYDSRATPAVMREKKGALLAALNQSYQELKVAEWGGYAGYDRFFIDPNNAKLASVALYNTLVPQFQRLIAQHNGAMPAFYAEVKAIAALDKDERAVRLAAAGN